MTANIPPGPVMLDLDGGTELDPTDRERLRHPLVGGVILFERNYGDPEQLLALTERLHSLRSPPLLIAVDQEGGRVQRFRRGFTSLPSARYYGDLYDQEPAKGLRAAKSMGETLARELRAVGVDCSFAPVLDVARVESDVIGDRAFHRDPDAVTRLAHAFISGMADAGMAAIGKHFPGHGGVCDDSHACLPCDHRDFAEVENCDLVPYRELIGLLGGVMTAHVQFDAIDTRIPTYSSWWLRKVLRDELGFAGIVFSDDLTMAGAETSADVVDRYVTAVEAGCNMILICNDRHAVDRVLSESSLSADAGVGALVRRLQTGVAEAWPY